MAKRKLAACIVKFTTTGPTAPNALLYDRHGHALNAMNFPRGYKLTPKARARARRILMAGCDELRATYMDRDKSTQVMAKLAKRRR